MEFLFASARTNKHLNTYLLTSWDFGDPLGKAGQLNGVMPIVKDLIRDIKNATQPDAVAVYAKDGNDYLWGGIVTNRRPTRGREGSDLTIIASQWESWFYTVQLPEYYFREGWDQLHIAQELATIALSKPGAPKIAVPFQGNSGVARQATFQKGKWVGEALDNLASRDNGFDWRITVREDATGQIEPVFVTSYPEQMSPGTLAALRMGTMNPPRPLFEQVDGKGNIVNKDLDEDVTGRASHVTAYGDGQPPDQPYATDEDPGLVASGLIRRETSSQYSGVTSSATLFDHARAERLARNEPIEILKVDYDPYAVPYTSFVTGDRAIVRIKDDWYEIDVPAARIVDRTLRGGRSVGLSASVALDMTSNTFPAVELNDA